MQTERTIVLPLADNDGNSLWDELNTIFDTILELAGGYSVVPQDGVWKDAKRTYVDKSLRVLVVSSLETDTLIEKCLPHWCRQLRQQCLYTHTVHVAVTFVEAA